MSRVPVPLSTYEPHEWVNMRVTYHGRSRAEKLFNQEFTVVDKREDNTSVAISSGGPWYWCAPWALHVVEPEPMTLKQAEEILNPLSSALEVLDNEIKRVSEQLDKLKGARQTLQGL